MKWVHCCEWKNIWFGNGWKKLTLLISVESNAHRKCHTKKTQPMQECPIYYNFDQNGISLYYSRFSFLTLALARSIVFRHPWTVDRVLTLYNMCRSAGSCSGTFEQKITSQFKANRVGSMKFGIAFVCNANILTRKKRNNKILNWKRCRTFDKEEKNLEEKNKLIEKRKKSKK